MKTYILIQIQIERNAIVDKEQQVTISNIIRKVQANSKEEAIGKFVLSTANIRAHQKLEIDCFDIDELDTL